MGTPHAVGVTSSASRIRTWLGVILLVIGFLGHLFAARAIGGTYVAFRDHILGFFFILIVTGGIIAGLGWKFWKGRHDVTLLIIGAVQAILGIVVYMQRFSVHG